jgi:hypothetical protein
MAYGSCVTVDENGNIYPLNEDGVDLIEALGLGDEDYRDYRCAIFGMLAELPVGGPSYCRLFGFPRELPDLSEEPAPKTNTRPDGIRDSFFDRHIRDELPEFY